MANPIVHWEICGEDAGKLKEFYTNLFDWKTQSFPEMDYHMVDTGEGSVGGGLAGSCDTCETKSCVTIYIQVDDLQKSLDKAIELGGEIITPPTVIPNDMGSYALFKDPGGNITGIWKAK